ncbi:MAG: hypothetical protein NC393_10290 [Clostridium sp.]|nr:hypothetical protein [Clostridium sp.]MCM1207491.1 hypothetical protein [Ruminococcus sp.]
MKRKGVVKRFLKNNFLVVVLVIAALLLWLTKHRLLAALCIILFVISLLGVRTRNAYGRIADMEKRVYEDSIGGSSAQMVSQKSDQSNATDMNLF